MASTNQPKKFRKRDVLIYAVIIIAVLLTVVVAAEVIEHLPSNRKKNGDDLNPPAVTTTAATTAEETTPEVTTTEATTTEATTTVTTTATTPATTTEVTTTTPPATEPPATEAPKTKATEKKTETKALEMGEDTKPADAVDEPETIADDFSETGYNNNIKNIVLIGVDKRDELEESKLYRTGGQSDVILIVSMNLKTKQFFMVSVNRDLCVPVENYSSTGFSYGWVDEQIALAYAYGDGGRASGKNVLKSLNKLMGDDIQFLGYIAAPIPIVSTVATKVGGVEVYIEDDFTGVDDTLVQGTTVNLLGQHAENFVRARMAMKYSNKNSLRMDRQITFMKAFINKAKTEMSAQQLIDLYTDILDMVKTNMGKKEITKWIAEAYDYEFAGITKITGTEGEPKHNARCTYIKPEEIAKTVKELYYKK